ncbi:MAG: efflux RND transporter permease subunit [Clostridia bacterium]|nr:efflux RND transporter permease subunit [Clostridia bacterium]
MKKWSFDKMFHFIVTKYRHIQRVFLVLFIICALFYPFVGVNYDLSSYLPQSAPSKQALDVMKSEFGYPGTARVMLNNVSIYEARRIREKISDVDGVSLAIGPDSVTDAYMSSSFAKSGIEDFNSQFDQPTGFYKDNKALIEVVFDEGNYDKKTREALDEIYKIAGDNACFSGSAVCSKEKQDAVEKELVLAMIIALVIIFAILTLTTESWFEPVLFILVMVVAIVLNLGSNIIFGTISFFSFSTSAILQLAVSMDYSIFLLHIYKDYKKSGMEVHEAMEVALKDACRSVFASGATTIVGFLAIAFMKFTIGRDVGFVLTKGILCSLATVVFLMPSLILRFDKIIEKTSHKPFIPSFDGFAKVMYKLRTPMLLIAILIAVPCYFGQSMNTFYFGDQASGQGPGTKVYEDNNKINDVFGKSNMILAIVPNGSVVKEKDLTKEIKDLDFVNYAVSLSDALPTGMPESFLPQDRLDDLRTKDYARIIISMKNEEESQYSFDCTDKLTEVVQKYYPKNSYVLGTTSSTMDVKKILMSDYNHVSILSLIGVIIVVMVTFRTIFIPILVIIPIEIAIYLNMTLPYIMGNSLLYIDYIIVSCLQLGATIDYSILLTNNYLDMRRQYDKKTAAVKATSKSALSILSSGSILVVVGYILYFLSSVKVISQAGRLVGRGALLSMLLVLSLLPALLAFFDKAIMHQIKNSDKRSELKRIKKGNKNKTEGVAADEVQ